MTEPILKTVWTYKGGNYIVVGFPEIKDDSDARWYGGVAYIREEDGEPTEDWGNVFVRKLADFSAKFREVNADSEVAVDE